MLEIIFWLTIKPFIAFFQALSGVLYPAETPELIRLQKVAVAVLALGSIAIIAAIILGLLSVQFWTVVCVFVIGVLLISIAGFLGHCIMRN